MYLQETCSGVPVSTTKPNDPFSNPGLRGGKAATKFMSYGTALLDRTVSVYV
jgi:hypothetical protein